MSERPVQPKQPVSAEVALFGGEKVIGEFFVSMDSPRRDSGPETLHDLLNDNSRSFVPFQTEGGIFLINRSTLRTVEFDSRELKELFERPDNEFIYALNVDLRTETQAVTLQGFCFTGDLPPDTRRPVDLLNSAEMFLLVYQAGNLMLVNKTAISHAMV